MKDKVLIISLIGLIAVIGNWIGYQVSPIEALPGIIIIIAITLIGWGITAILPFKSPSVVWISLVALLITSPIFPGNSWLAEATAKLNFMALATPILAYAGLSLGKDIESFKRLSWRIVVISLVVYTGTFFFAALFAEIVFRIQGRF
ncbi:hypothetical protein NDK47_13310 [Brevibacillus ruminantium]|uniref:DUF340 domain-containing protein n=1 Tax=Brevibacillus ruminantium TaxID=2950604 RepID=A0ABY4WM11_9BACL|nr:hypothetical protein [Brevibacillus ruminantium]USG68196.1 hypothetical protein NDK47_13310 [Brevibacillus ruminantium]